MNCTICNKSYSSRFSLKRHLAKIHHRDRDYTEDRSERDVCCSEDRAEQDNFCFEDETEQDKTILENETVQSNTDEEKLKSHEKDQQKAMQYWHWLLVHTFGEKDMMKFFQFKVQIRPIPKSPRMQPGAGVVKAKVWTSRTMKKMKPTSE